MRLLFDPATDPSLGLPQELLLFVIKGEAWRIHILCEGFVCMLLLLFLNLYSLCVFVFVFNLPGIL